MIDYSPFWETLKKKKLSTYALIKYYQISGSLIHRLKHNLPITTETINDLCTFMGCDVQDIMVYIPSENDRKCEL